MPEERPDPLRRPLLPYGHGRAGVPGEAGGVREKCFDRLGERRGVPGRHDEAGAVLADRLAQGTDVGDDDGPPLGVGVVEDAALGGESRIREDDEVGSGEQIDLALHRNMADLDVETGIGGHRLEEPLFERPVPAAGDQNRDLPREPAHGVEQDVDALVGPGSVPKKRMEGRSGGAAGAMGP